MKVIIIFSVCLIYRTKKRTTTFSIKAKEVTFEKGGFVSTNELMKRVGKRKIKITYPSGKQKIRTVKWLFDKSIETVIEIYKREL